ncbi:MAG: toll/interleukin-1 receptor domain-containing protein [Bacteroidales bacterium]|nr:toll/interleukin-1 receptor domain-containing protein [Bacteroidales bacterium]
MKKYDVFISYSRKDYVDEKRNVIPDNVVSKIKDALSSAEITYWFDEDGIDHGDDFADKIVANIEASEIFVFL